MARAELKTAQCRIKPRRIIAEGCGGTIFWATPTRARLLIDVGAVELVNMVPVQAGPVATRPIGPTEAPVAGPSEVKEPPEKRSSAVVPDGPSIDSQSSSEPGTAALSSASAAGLLSPERISPPSKKRGRPKKSG